MKSIAHHNLSIMPSEKLSLTVLSNAPSEGRAAATEPADWRTLVRETLEISQAIKLKKEAAEAGPGHVGIYAAKADFHVAKLYLSGHREIIDPRHVHMSASLPEVIHKAAEIDNVRASCDGFCKKALQCVVSAVNKNPALYSAKTRALAFCAKAFLTNRKAFLSEPRQVAKLLETICETVDDETRAKAGRSIIRNICREYPGIIKSLTGMPLSDLEQEAKVPRWTKDMRAA